MRHVQTSFTSSQFQPLTQASSRSSPLGGIRQCRMRVKKSKRTVSALNSDLPQLLPMARQEESQTTPLFATQAAWPRSPTLYLLAQPEI